MKKIWFWLIIIIILGVGLSLLSMKKTEKEPSEELILSKTGTYQEITGFSLTEYISGQKKVAIKAEEASIRPKIIGFFKTPLIKETHMVRPEIFFFTEAKLVSHIMADSGKMNMGNKKIILKEGVFLVTPDGKRLSAKQMSVDPKSGLLSVKGIFTLKKGGEIIKGKGLKSDIELKDFKIRTRRDQ